jgi:hypothetical protein
MQIAIQLLITIYTVYGEGEARAAARRLNAARFTHLVGGFPSEYIEMTTSTSPVFARYLSMLPAPERRPTVREIAVVHSERLGAFDFFARVTGDATHMFGARDTPIFVADPTRTSVQERQRFRETCARLLTMIGDVMSQPASLAVLHTINVATAREDGRVH